MYDSGLEALNSIYEGIKRGKFTTATSTWGWVDDFFEYWSYSEYDSIDLGDIDLISVYLNETGRLEGRGVIYAIGEWLDEHHKHEEYEPKHMKE